MALPALNWRRLAPVTLAANTINDMIDAIYLAGTAATYADGSARTPGSGSAWTWLRDTTNAIQPGATTAAYGTPPSPYTGTQAVLFCGSTASPTGATFYNVTVSETAAATALYAGVVKTPGAYSNWTSATPFTTGSFSGLASAAVIPATAVWGTLYMWESEEAVIIQFGRAAASGTSAAVVGAFVEPPVGSGESDDRLYGLGTTGRANNSSTTWWFATSDSPWYETGINGGSRFGMFRPGTSTIDGYARFGQYIPVIGMLTRNNEIPAIPVYAGPNSTARPQLPGRLREIWITRDAIAGQVLQVGGVDAGYIVSGFHTTTAADAALLTV